MRLDLLEGLDPVEKLELLAEMVPQDQEVNLDLLDLVAPLDHLDLKDQLAHRDHVDPLERPVNLESLVVMASLDLLDLLE